MKVFATPHLRNVALVGHGHAGKTSLVAAMLYTMGVTPRLGKVADGTTVTDFDEVAITHQLSTHTSVAHGVWRNHKLNLLDTPGAAAFILDSRLALRASETALIVLDAHNGVEIGTETVRQYAAEFNLPCFVFINKLDKEQTDVEGCLQALAELCDLRPVLLQLPIGSEKQFRGLWISFANGPFSTKPTAAEPLSKPTCRPNCKRLLPKPVRCSLSEWPKVMIGFWKLSLSKAP